MFLLNHNALLRTKVDKKTVAITGSSDGIGAHLAKRLAAAGATVILVARSEEKLKQVGDCIRGNGGTAHEYVANLAKQEECERVVKEILADHEVIDVFVSNAGRSIRRSVKYQATDRFHDFHRLMALNFFGGLNMILNILPGMKARGSGHIVHISSFGVPMRQPRFAGYIASKSALDSALASIAAEVWSDGIRTSSVYMPLVQTKMVAKDDYEHFSLLDLDGACGLIEHAIVTQKQEVMDASTRAVNQAYVFVPWLVTFVMSLVYRFERERAPDDGGNPVLNLRSPDASPDDEKSASSEDREKKQTPSRKKKRPSICLRALGSLLWTVRTFEGWFQFNYYLVTPLLIALYVMCVYLRDIIFTLRNLGPVLTKPSVQAPICVLILALAWTSRPASAVGMACANVLFNVACAISSNDGSMRGAESYRDDCTRQSVR